MASDRLSLVFAALADPTRRSILSRLSSGPTTVGQLASPFAMTASAISQHLKVLERAGLVERTVQAQWRTVALRAESLDDAAQWIDQHQRIWNESFDLLEERLLELKQQSPQHISPKEKQS